MIDKWGCQYSHQKRKLTLDGTVGKLQRKSVDKNLEERTIRTLYFSGLADVLIFNVIMFYRKVLRQLKKRGIFESTKWISLRKRV